ncbi:MAG: hypothetical protein IPJ51_11600 [Saprospiraceae bacterium]|nr:hypothetical protein [Saprospiraceae bacterium]
MKIKNQKNTLIVGLFLIIGVFLFYCFLPIYTTYYISANTERVKFLSLDKNNSKVNLNNVTIWAEDTVPILQSFTGTLDINDSIDVTIERVGFGPATITFDGQKSVGNLSWITLDGKEHIKELSNYNEIDINNIESEYRAGKSQIIRIDGNIDLGKKIDYEIKDESTAILKEGEINMIGKTKYISSNFEASKKFLQIGDQFVINEPIGKGFGFVNFNENAGMTVSYRIMAKTAKIVKPGPIDALSSSDYEIKANILDRFKNDSKFSLLSIIIGFILILTTIITFTYDSINFFREPKVQKYN